MPGPAPKPSHLAVRKTPRTRERVLAVLPDRLEEVPEPPSPLGASGKKAWAAFWASPLAQVVRTDSDLEALRRLFLRRDESARLWRRACKEPVVIGSSGQMRPNPLFDVVSRLDGEVRALEDRFGLTPQARLRLGVTFAQGQAVAERVSREINADDEDEDDPRETPDARA